MKEPTTIIIIIFHIIMQWFVLHLQLKKLGIKRTFDCQHFFRFFIFTGFSSQCMAVQAFYHSHGTMFCWQYNLWPVILCCVWQIVPFSPLYVHCLSVGKFLDCPEWELTVRLQGLPVKGDILLGQGAGWSVSNGSPQIWLTSSCIIWYMRLTLKKISIYFACGL